MQSLAAVPPATHSVRTRLVLSAAAWVLAYFAVQYVLDELHPTPPWDMVVASVPVFMFYLFAWAVQSGLRQADELQRRIHLEALAMAFLIVMVAVMFLGLMEDSPRGHLWFRLRDLWLAMLPLYAICYAAAWRHYRQGVRNDLRERRAGKGWSQGDLAERLGVSRQTVNAIETGKYDPSLELAFRIARVFRARIEDIFLP